MVKNLPADVGDARDTGSILGSGRSPGEGNGNPHQYSCLVNPMNRGAWWARVHGSQIDTTEGLSFPPERICIYFFLESCILPTGDAFRLHNEVWTLAAGSGLSFQSLNLRLTLTLILQTLLFSLDSSFSSLCMFMYVLLFCYCWKFPSASVFFWPCLEVFEILVPQLEIKPVHPTVEIQCPNHWTAREFPPSVSCESSVYYKAYYYPVLMPLEYHIRASVHHSASSIPVSPLKCAAKI